LKKQKLPKNSGKKTVTRRVGLARTLSKMGYCSRSEAAALVHAGRVRLNESLTCNPEAPVHLGKDRVAVDGAVVKAGAKVYFVMNKPRGVVTTAADEKGRELYIRCCLRIRRGLGRSGGSTRPVKECCSSPMIQSGRRR
jgi:23S rRNA pseudouridine2605 synthase